MFLLPTISERFVNGWLVSSQSDQAIRMLPEHLYETLPQAITARYIGAVAQTAGEILVSPVDIVGNTLTQGQADIARGIWALRNHFGWSA